MSLKEPDTDQAECFSCFRVHPGETLPKCTGSIGGGYGMQHEMCGDCLKHHARDVVVQNPNKLSPNGILCTIGDCIGTFSIEILQPIVEPEIFEEIRAHGQRLDFEEARRAGLAVERCKKCTFFNVYDESPEQEPNFHCRQCLSEHCRQCDQDWDDEHKQLRTCAESAREERRRQEKEKQDELLAKKLALEAEKEKAKQKKEKEEENRRSMQNPQNATPNKKFAEQRSPADSVNSDGDYQDAVDAPPTPQHNNCTPLRRPPPKAPVPTPKSSRKPRVPTREAPSEEDTVLQYRREFADGEERVREMIEEQQKKQDEEMISLRAALVDIQTAFKKQHEEQDEEIAIMRAQMQGLQASVDDNLTRIYDLQRVVLRMQNESYDMKKSHEAEVAQLVQQLHSSQLQTNERNAETIDLMRELGTLKDSHKTLADRVDQQDAIMLQQQRQLAERQFEPPSPTALRPTPLRQTSPIQSQSPFQPPQPQQTKTQAGGSEDEDLMAWKARMKEDYEKKKRQQSEAQPRTTGGSSPVQPPRRGDFRPSAGGAASPTTPSSMEKQDKTNGGRF